MCVCIACLGWSDLGKKKKQPKGGAFSNDIKSRFVYYSGSVPPTELSDTAEYLESDEARRSFSSKTIHHLLSSGCLIYFKHLITSSQPQLVEQNRVERGFHTTTVFSLFHLPLWNAHPLRSDHASSPHYPSDSATLEATNDLFPVLLLPARLHF